MPLTIQPKPDKMLHNTSMERDKIRKELLSKLKKEGAGCLEMALNGFIRIYEKDEEKCNCKDCILLDKECSEDKLINLEPME